MLALSSEHLVAHWLQKAGNQYLAYGVRLTLSSDAGQSWSASLVPHRDASPTENGFVTLLPWNDGGGAAVWLDGRDMKATKKMTLRSALIGADGQPGEEVVLDDNVCSCCQTAGALTSEGEAIVRLPSSEGGSNTTADSTSRHFTRSLGTSTHSFGGGRCGNTSGYEVIAGGRNTGWVVSLDESPNLFAHWQRLGLRPARLDDGSRIDSNSRVP